MIKTVKIYYKKWLLLEWGFFWPYLILPLCIITAVVDHLFLKGKLANLNLLKVFPFILIFNLPHIIQSFYPLVKKEYANKYLYKIIIGFPLIATFFFLLFEYSAEIFLIIFVGLTAYHISRQQIGVLFLSFSIPPSKMMRFWSNYFVSFIVVLYLISTVWRDYHEQHHLIWLYIILIALYCLCSSLAFMTLSTSTKDTRNFMLTAGSAVLFSILLISGYGLFSFFAMRFIHDFTAFSLYIARDIGFEGKQINLVNILEVSIYPLSAIMISFFLFTNYYHASTFLISLVTIYHYYIESFMWKRGSLNVMYLKSSFIVKV